MKLLRLSLFRMVGYLQVHRMMFLLFFVGTMLSSFVFLYFYGNSLKYTVTVGDNDPEYRLFELFLPEGTPVTEEQVNLLDHYGIDEVSLATTAVLPPELASKVPEQAYLEVMTARENGEKIGLLLFTPEQKEKGGILVDKIFGYDLEEMTVNGKVFPVAGTIDHGNGGIIVPTNLFLQEFATANSISWITSDILSEREIEAAVEEINTAFPQQEGLYTPEEALAEAAEVQQKEILQAGLMYMVSLLSFLFLFQYLQEKTRTENAIYQVLGADKGTIFFLVFLEIGLLAFAACGLTSLIHAIGYERLFSRLNMMEIYIPYTLTDYLIVLAATTLLSLVTAIPFVVSCLRQSPVELRTRYDR